MAMAAALIAGVVVLGGLTLAVTAYVLRTRCVARHWSAKLFFGMTSSSETAHTFGSGPDVELQTRQPWDDLAEHIRLLADHLPRETRRLKELVDMNGVDSIRRQILAGLLLVEPTKNPSSQHTRLEAPLRNLRAKPDSPRSMDPTKGHIVIQLQDCIVDDGDLKPDDESYPLKLFVSLVQAALRVPQLAKFMLCLEETEYVQILLSGLSDMDLSDGGASGDSKQETVILGRSSPGSPCPVSHEDSIESSDSQKPILRKDSPPSPSNSSTRREFFDDQRDDQDDQSENEADANQLWPQKVIAALDRRQSQEKIMLAQDTHPSTPTGVVPMSPVSLKLSFNTASLSLGEDGKSGPAELVSLGLVHWTSEHTDTVDRANSGPADLAGGSSEREFNPISLDSPWRRSMAQVYADIDPSSSPRADCGPSYSFVEERGAPKERADGTAGEGDRRLSDRARTSVDHIRRALSDLLVEPDDDTKDDSACKELPVDVECGWDYHPAKIASSDEVQRPEYASAPQPLSPLTPRSTATSIQSSPRIDCGRVTPREVRLLDLDRMTELRRFSTEIDLSSWNVEGRHSRDNTPRQVAVGV